MTGGHDPYEPGEPCRNYCGLPVRGPGYSTRHVELERGRCNIMLMEGSTLLAVIRSDRVGLVASMLNRMGE